MAQSPLTKKQKTAMTKKVGAAAAKIARKTIKAPTPAQIQKSKALNARKRVKAIIGKLTPTQRKATILQLQTRKKNRGTKK